MYFERNIIIYPSRTGKDPADMGLYDVPGFRVQCVNPAMMTEGLPCAEAVQEGLPIWSVPRASRPALDRRSRICLLATTMYLVLAYHTSTSISAQPYVRVLWIFK